MSYKKNKISVPELEFGHMPPNSPEIERAVLGAIMLEKDCRDESMTVLQESMFYGDSNKTVFQAISELYKEKKSVDILTVTQKLRSLEKLEYVGGAYFISNLTSSIGSTNHTPDHIAVLKEMYVCRKAIEHGAILMSAAYGNQEVFKGVDIFQVIKLYEEGLNELNNEIVGNEDIDMVSVVENRYVENITPRKTFMKGIPTGNEKLDKYTLGWRKAKLIILAARPSNGKTTKAIQLVCHAAKLGYKPGYWSMEVDKDELIDIMLAQESGVSDEKISFQKMNPEELERYTNSKEWLKRSGIYINDKAKINLNYLGAVARKRKRQYGLDMIVIDYLQLMEEEDGTNREQQVSKISRGLKQLAKELDIPIIALCQLNRDLEKRTGSKRPQLSDLRESGGIEADADIVLYLYPPSEYNTDQRKDLDYKDMDSDHYKQLMEIGFLKHRGGKKVRFLEYFDRDKKIFRIEPFTEKKEDELPF